MVCVLLTCPGLSWCSERMMASLSPRDASCGSHSEMAIPGAEVAIGRNSPRYSNGASGLRSNVSMWLGPPHSHSTMIDFPLELFAPAVAASKRNSSGNDKLANPASPSCNRARRFKVPMQRSARVSLANIDSPPETILGGQTTTHHGQFAANMQFEITFV